MQKKKQEKIKDKKKIHIALKIALGILISIIVISATLAITGYITFNKVANKFDTITLEENDLGVVPEEELQQFEDYTEIINIALFGIDSTDASSGRSDSIMIATLDPIHNKLKLTSFMRDSYVYIADYGYDKLNHAYAYGGPSLAINTLNTNFGLNITDFAAVDFASLPKIIDALGGIDLEIREDEIEYINSYIYHLTTIEEVSSPLIDKAGLQHVNGIQALAYTRIRYTSGGDSERTQRQRTVLEALFNEALNLPPNKYLSVINNLSQYVTTSLDVNEMLRIGTKAASLGLSGITIEQQRYPLDNYSYDGMVDDIYYLLFDEVATKEQVMNYIFNDIDVSESEDDALDTNATEGTTEDIIVDYYDSDSDLSPDTTTDYSIDTDEPIYDEFDTTIDTYDESTDYLYPYSE